MWARASMRRARRGRPARRAPPSCHLRSSAPSCHRYAVRRHGRGSVRMRGRARSIRASWFCGPRAATRTSRTTRVSVSGTRHAVARGACGTSSDARAGERDRVRPAAMVLASRRARARTGDWLPGRMDAAGGASEAGGERGRRRRHAHLTKTTSRDGTTDDSDALFLMGTFLIYYVPLVSEEKTKREQLNQRGYSRSLCASPLQPHTFPHRTEPHTGSLLRPAHTPSPIL